MDRRFGFTVGIAAAALSCLGMLRGRPPRISLLVLGFLAIAVAIVRPRLLAPVRRGWAYLQRQISRVTNPIVMALLFGLVIIPVAVALRVAGKTPLQLRRRKDTYWEPVTKQVDMLQPF